jgi:hypothetical protein
MVELGVGPFVGQGAVEAFDFAVGLGSIWSGAPVLDVAQGVGEGVGSVAGSVVGQHVSDCDSTVDEPGVGSEPKLCGSFLAIVA